MKYKYNDKKHKSRQESKQVRSVLHEKRMCKQEIYSSSYPLVITLSQSFFITSLQLPATSGFTAERYKTCACRVRRRNHRVPVVK